MLYSGCFHHVNYMMTENYDTFYINYTFERRKHNPMSRSTKDSNSVSKICPDESMEYINTVLDYTRDAGLKIH